MTFDAIWLEYAIYILGGLLVLIGVAHSFTAWRYGARMPLTAFSSAIFIGGCCIIIWLTLSTLSSTDWTSTFSVTMPHIPWLNFSF
jgi:hypothetical protein